MANLAYWKERTKIDYFTHFIQTYILFNAWYRGHYGNSMREFQVLEEIKFKPNLVRGRIIPLLSDLQDSDGVQLRANIAWLHNQLERMHLHNNKTSKRITCTCIGLGKNQHPHQQGQYAGVKYEVNATDEKKILVKVTKSNGHVQFEYEQTGYNWADVESHTAFKYLSPTQNTQLKSFYTYANPKQEVNLLDLKNGNPLQVGAYQFCDNTEHIFAGLVGIIYDLRNLLFHGELVPADDYNETYGAAYHVLKQFVKNIPDTV